MVKTIKPTPTNDIIYVTYGILHHITPTLIPASAATAVKITVSHRCLHHYHHQQHRGTLLHPPELGGTSHYFLRHMILLIVLQD